MSNESSASAEEEQLGELRRLVARRQLRDARSFAEQLAGRFPRDTEVRFLLAVIQAQLNEPLEALHNIRKALADEPHAAWNKRLVLVNILRDVGDPRGAEEEARRLIDAEPQRVQLLNALGLALCDQLRLDEAVQTFRMASSVDPTYAAAYLNAASALRQQDRVSEALSVLELGITRIPQNDALLLSLAKLHEEAGAVDRAIAAYSSAARANPDGARDVYRRLGHLHYRNADLYSAITAYEHAVRQDETDPELWNLLGNAYMDVAALAQATRCYRTALALAPSHADIYDNLLVLYHYDPTIPADAMFEAHREWARRFAPQATADAAAQTGAARVAVRPAGRQRRAAARPVRIGFVARSLCSGATGFFLLPLARHLDASRYEPVFYHAGSRSDAITAELQQRAAHWRDVAQHTDDALADQIRADTLDVIVDLDGHVPGNRLRAIARKPAPVAITWLDYFDTTGLDSIDFLFGDPISTPVDGPQRFTETVLRLEPSRLCYAPPDYAPLPAPAPALSSGYVTFGSFNRLAKLAEPVVELWARLLRLVPRSMLLLKSTAFNHPNTRAVFAQRFQTRGVSADRLMLRGSSPHVEMLSQYADVDIALDPFPYNGGLTTCEALWMGVPVMALLGDSMISRQSATLLYAAGLDDWVARTPDEWLARTSALALDVDRLASVRANLRSRVAGSPIVDGRSFTATFETLLEHAIATASRRPSRDPLGR